MGKTTRAPPPPPVDAWTDALTSYMVYATELTGTLTTRAKEKGHLLKESSRRSSALLGETLGRDVNDHAAAAVLAIAIIMFLLLGSVAGRCRHKPHEKGEDGTPSACGQVPSSSNLHAARDPTNGSDETADAARFGAGFASPTAAAVETSPCVETLPVGIPAEGQRPQPVGAEPSAEAPHRGAPVSSTAGSGQVGVQDTGAGQLASVVGEVFAVRPAAIDSFMSPVATADDASSVDLIDVALIMEASADSAAAATAAANASCIGGGFAADVGGGETASRNLQEGVDMGLDSGLAAATVRDADDVLQPKDRSENIEDLNSTLPSAAAPEYAADKKRRMSLPTLPKPFRSKRVKAKPLPAGEGQTKAASDVSPSMTTVAVPTQTPAAAPTPTPPPGAGAEVAVSSTEVPEAIPAAAASATVAVASAGESEERVGDEREKEEDDAAAMVAATFATRAVVEPEEGAAGSAATAAACPAVPLSSPRSIPTEPATVEWMEVVTEESFPASVVEVETALSEETASVAAAETEGNASSQPDMSPSFPVPVVGDALAAEKPNIETEAPPLSSAAASDAVTATAQNLNIEAAVPFSGVMPESATSLRTAAAPTLGSPSTIDPNSTPAADAADSNISATPPPPYREVCFDDGATAAASTGGSTLARLLQLENDEVKEDDSDGDGQEEEEEEEHDEEAEEEDMSVVQLYIDEQEMALRQWQQEPILALALTGGDTTDTRQGGEEAEVSPCWGVVASLEDGRGTRSTSPSSVAGKMTTTVDASPVSFAKTKHGMGSTLFRRRSRSRSKTVASSGDGAAAGDDAAVGEESEDAQDLTSGKTKRLKDLIRMKSFRRSSSSRAKSFSSVVDKLGKQPK